MKVHKHTFSSGLRLVTIPIPNLTSATVTVWVGVGSRHENKEVSGISHFLEHMVFKGGQKYKNAKEISETIDVMGAEFNAGTSKDYTNYYIKTQVSLLDKAFDILSDIVLTPSLDEAEIKKEKGVIIEEINMYEDTPMYKIGDIFDEIIFADNSLGRDISGTKKTVGEDIVKNDFVKHKNTFYNSHKMLITIAGGVTEKEAINLTQKYFSSINTNKNNITEEKFSLKQNKPQLKLVNKKIEQAHIMLGNIAKPYGDSTRYVQRVLKTILGGGMSSRLFTEVREKRGLCYSVHMGSDHYIDIGTVATYTGTDPKKAPEALKIILSEINDLAAKKKPIKKAELQKAKDYIKGHVTLSLESSSFVGSYFGYDELILGKHTTPEEDFAEIDKVTKDDVYALANELFVKNTLNLAIIGPFKSSNVFERILE